MRPACQLILCATVGCNSSSGGPGAAPATGRSGSSSGCPSECPPPDALSKHDWSSLTASCPSKSRPQRKPSPRSFSLCPLLSPYISSVSVTDLAAGSVRPSICSGRFISHPLPALHTRSQLRTVESSSSSSYPSTPPSSRRHNSKMVGLGPRPPPSRKGTSEWLGFLLLLP